MYDVRRHIRFGTEATAAEFDTATGRWTVTTASGQKLRARILVAGLGPLSRYTLPKLPGLERFRGKVFHSAGWDHSFDLAGKRVAIIGTGASAIQFVPELAARREAPRVPAHAGVGDAAPGAGLRRAEKG